MQTFTSEDLEKLYQAPSNSNGEDNGQVTIIGGSTLFHGAPLFSLTAASRVVDMVFFASPEPSIRETASQLKAQLSSFIWVPWSDIESYIEKSDAILIGPGFMRYSSESQAEASRLACDAECQKTREVTLKLLNLFPEKKWVIDAGSLQTMEADWIPAGAVVTPNKHEFDMLFSDEILRLHSAEQNSAQDDKSDEEIVSDLSNVESMARKYNCTIVYKGPETLVTNGVESIVISGGNAGLTKGGTGDTLAGLTTALLAKNDPILAASAATYILKKTAEKLEKTVGTNFNADDLAAAIFPTFRQLVSNQN